MTSTPTAEPFALEVTDVELADELRDSFIPYALSVTTSRAIPDARDGLKPVQRRILTAMSRLGLEHRSPHRKSAAVVGEVMGKYHPHGDAAIYEAMVRMGQPFSVMVPYVDGKGNFGGLDDPPAASRYTEARLSAAADAMLAGLTEDAVDETDTYDAERTEPTVLPSLIPNLLVNGVSGIAVGVTTAIPPHNLGEVVAAVESTLSGRARKPRLEQLREHILGPDFPSGGTLLDDGGLDEAYSTGKGHVVLRATCAREGRTLVFTELPYQVGPERVTAAAQDAAEKGRIPGASAVRDESDRHGVRLVVTVKRGASADDTLAALYKHTPLEQRVGISMVALIDGVAKECTLAELVATYAQHVTDVTRRRTEHQLERARRRAHILTGLLAAVDRIDMVVKVIRAAKTTAEAKATLMRRLKIDDTQADAVLDMRLRRLTGLEADDLRAQLAAANSTIAACEKTLSSQQRLRAATRQALRAACDPLLAPRRTSILRDGETVATQVHPLTLTTGGAATSGTVPLAVSVVSAEQLVTVTADGTARQEAQPDGTGLVGLLDATQPAVVATSTGRAVHVTAAAALTDGKLAGVLQPKERVIAAVNVTPEHTDLVLATAGGYALRTPLDGIAAKSTPRPVSAITVGDGDRLVAAAPGRADHAGDLLLLLTDNQELLALTPADLPEARRGNKGLLVTPRSGNPALLVAGARGPHAAAQPKRKNSPPTRPEPNPRRGKPHQGFTAVGVTQ